jgi:hypothetical protein
MEEQLHLQLQRDWVQIEPVRENRPERLTASIGPPTFVLLRWCEHLPIQLPILLHPVAAVQTTNYS